MRVAETTFHASDPQGPQETISTPPKHFGKIDITAFDPEHGKNTGPR